MEGCVHGGVGTSWRGGYMEGYSNMEWWVHGGVCTWRGGYIMEGWVHGGVWVHGENYEGAGQGEVDGEEGGG